MTALLCVGLLLMFCAENHISDERSDIYRALKVFAMRNTNCMSLKYFNKRLTFV